MLTDTAEILQSQTAFTEHSEPVPDETTSESAYSEDIIRENAIAHKSFYRRNTCAVNLAVSVILGMVTGAFLSDASIDVFLSAPYIKQNGAEFVTVFASSLLDTFMYIGIVFMLGFSAVSLPIAALVPFVKGLGIGFNLALAISSGNENVLILIVMAFPYILVSSFCIIIATKECIGFSYMLFGLVTKGGQQVYFINPIGSRYAGIFLYISIAGAVTSAVNALIFTISI